jgi:hypothetical protein
MTHPSASLMNHTPVGRNTGGATVAVTGVTRDVAGTLLAAGRDPPVHPPVTTNTESNQTQRFLPIPELFHAARPR